MFRMTQRSSSRAQEMHWQPLVLRTCEVAGRRGFWTLSASWVPDDERCVARNMLSFI
jgi:hypothetical protein